MALNLKKSVVQEHWRKKAPRLSKVLMVMEGMEFWLVDDVRSVNDALTDLANKLERASSENLLSHAERLMYVMAYMSSSRSLRLMNWFDERFQNSNLSLAMIRRANEMVDEPHARLLLDRLQVLKALSLLGQVFMPARSRAIVALLKNEAKNRSGAQGSGSSQRL